MNPLRYGLCLLVLTGAMALASRPLLAAPAESPAPAAVQGHGESEEAPNIFGGSLFASLIAIAVFLGMVAILSKTAYPKILSGLKVREEKIEHSLRAAERATQETERVTAELEAKMVATRAEATKLVEKSKEDALVIAQTELEKARVEIKLERERAQREIHIARDSALQEIVDKAADWSVQLAAKILQQEVSPEKHRELIGQAVEQLRRPDSKN